MVSKCANPECDVRFRYLRSGKLFRFDVAVNAPESAVGKAGVASKAFKRPAHRIEHFWLCDECAASMTLKHDKTQGVIVIPLHPRKHRASA